MSQVQHAFPLTPGEAILILRRRRKWTQADLAREAGVYRTLVSRAERDDDGLLVWNYRPIFRALGCEFSVRLGDECRADDFEKGEDEPTTNH